MYATKLAMQTLGRRVLDIDADCARLNSELAALVRATAPSLLALHGVELTRSDGHLPCGPMCPEWSVHVNEEELLVVGRGPASPVVLG